MKVLVLNFEKTWRGGERQTLYNMQGFNEKGIDVVLACRKNTPLAQKAEHLGYEVKAYENVFGIIGLLLSQGSHFDVIHVQTSHMLTYAAYTKPFHNTKVVFTRRVNFQPKGFFTRLKYQLSDRVVAISQSVKRVLNDFGIRQVTVISDIVIPKSLDNSRAKTLLHEVVKEGKLVVATMAALTKDKDPMTMVASIKQLSELRDDFIFLHFGSGDMEGEVQARVSELNMSDYYKLVGFYENVEDFFSIIDVFVMSSEQEGLGSIVLDAFMNKVPVVATKAGGLEELVEECRGIPCAIKDSKAIAEGINKLLNNPFDSMKMVDNAHRYVLENHSSEQITEKYIKLFEGL